MARRVQYQQKAIVPPTKGTNSWLETVSVDRYMGEQPPVPQANWKAAAMYSVAAVMPYIAFVTVGTATFKERTTPDKWLAQKPDIIYDVKRLQYTYPTFFFDPIPFPSTVTMDRWSENMNQPILDVKRLSYTYPNFFFHPTPIVTVGGGATIRTLALLGVGS